MDNSTIELLTRLERSQVAALYIAYLQQRHDASRDPKERELIRRVLGNVIKLA